MKPRDRAQHLDRRDFLQLAGASAVIGAFTPWQAAREIPKLEYRIHAPSAGRKPGGMPGKFPARVIEVFHSNAIVDKRVSEPAVKEMVERGMRELTGVKKVTDAWRIFFDPSDVVAIKPNPSGVLGTTTSPELVREVIRGLELAGVKRTNIIVYDRFPWQLFVSSYHGYLPPGVRAIGTADVLAVGPAAVGHDPDVYFETTCFAELETRSYLSTVASRLSTKIINLPCLKEHGASGPTGCLKNISYGSFTNVARTHTGTDEARGLSGPPYCYIDPIVPLLCSVEPLRSKLVLNIMDGLRGVWHGGPFAASPDFIWEAKTLYFGTDPVALDRIELELLERKRREKGAPSLWDRDPSQIGSQTEKDKNPAKNWYYRATGHVRTAGLMGLGTWDLYRIRHSKLEVG
ncbi:MAG: DUF362 domain-containing protein [Acidobacteria bacterium]|nr:MAG: DUF362 domain-containing protein [Acidobacteriota bacterium]